MFIGNKNLIGCIILLGFFSTGCNKNDSGPAQTPASQVVVPVQSEPIPDPSEQPPVQVDNNPPQQVGCSADADLSTVCIKKLISSSSPRMTMWTNNGGFSKSAKGPWKMSQMFEVRRDKSLRKMKGINRDGSQAGPLLVWNDYAEFQDWGDEGQTYKAYDIFQTPEGAVRFELERITLFSYDNLILECFIPSGMEGKKLLCVWYRFDYHTHRDVFRGYIEFDRAKKHRH